MMIEQLRQELYGFKFNTWYTGTIKKDVNDNDSILINEINYGQMGNFVINQMTKEMPGFLFRTNNDPQHEELYDLLCDNLGKTLHFMVNAPLDRANSPKSGELYIDVTEEDGEITKFIVKDYSIFT